MEKKLLKKMLSIRSTVFFALLVFLPGRSYSQSPKLKISDFVIFGGNRSSTDCGVELNANVNIYSGNVGSYSLIRSGGNFFLEGNLHSGGTIELNNNSTIKGLIAASNFKDSKGDVFLAGSKTIVSKNIDVNGNISIKNGSIEGKVTHPKDTEYKGPKPQGGENIGIPTLPQMPDMPQINDFPEVGSENIAYSKIIRESSYGNLNLKGNQTITFSGVGVYVFKSIKSTGATNNFVFDFKGNTDGVFKIYIYGDADLDKISTTLVNGGSATRIYTETHGTGSTSSSKTDAFIIGNGSSGKGSSKWSGTVWAPYGSINIGSGGSGLDIIGALYSGKNVTLKSGTNIKFAPFKECIKPDVQAGVGKILDCTITSVRLSGSSNTPNAQYSWRAINGGVISSGEKTSTPTVTAAGDYILTISSAASSCYASDTVNVTFEPCILPDYPPPPGGKINNLIGAELNSLFLNFRISNNLSSNIFQIRTDSVLIDVIARDGRYGELLALLQTANYGITDLINNGPNTLFITGKYPIKNLKKLDELPLLIDYCRPLVPALRNSGITTTQGDIAIGGDFIRNGYNLFGAGVKIGILSDSYNTLKKAQIDIDNGDLPGAGNPQNILPVQVLKDYPFGEQTDEGRAMLQIVHDIAPKANLAFRTGFISPGDFAQGIIELQQAKCDIIVDDITFITESFFQDGVVAKAVDQVASKGVAYFSAAGNYGKNSYESIFNPAAAPPGVTGVAHNFGSGDVLQNISLTKGSYTIVLQWDDPIYSLGQTQTGTINDLDIFLSDNNGTTLFGFNRNNIGTDPIEILPFKVTVNTTSNILITRAAGTGNVRFKYLIFRGEATINEFNIGTSTIVGQANAVGAIAVGAVLYTNTPAFGNVPSIASFSSTGGTAVNGQIRNKPDYAAPNGVNTTVELFGKNIDNDKFPNFFGTSAAAPHAAASAALLIEAKKKYSNLSIIPEDLRNLMRSTTIGIGAPGFNFISGFGFIQPDVALRTFASPKPELIKLNLPTPDFLPGINQFTMKVTGKYLDPTSVVTFRGKPIATTFINKFELEASIPAFTGNPAIQVFTKSLSINKTDGGFSDTLFFFSPVKKKIVVKADNKVKKFGEKLPVFTVSVLVDDVPLANTQLTISDLGLQNILYTTPASNQSTVANYFIRPSIAPLDPNKPDDAALLENYSYSFLDGILSIQKLQLTITPKDTTLTYGDKLSDFNFKFEYDKTNIEANERIVFENTLIATYKKDLTRAIALVDARQLVNSRALVNADLERLSFLVSARAVVNARQIINARVLINNVTVLDTNRIVDVAVESVFNYQQNDAVATLVSAKQLVNARALINAKALVNGTASVNARQLVNNSPIVNSNTIDNTVGQTVVIIDEADVNAPSDDKLTEFKSIVMVTGITSGTYAIVPGALPSGNFEIAYGLGKLNILPTALIVRAEDKCINKGSSLPGFTSAVTGYKNREILPIASGPRYTLSPRYCGLAGVYSIQPSDLIFCDPNPNYLIKYVPGTLYVNPKGWGAIAVKPTMDCIQVLNTNHPSGYKYVARFSYRNENSVPVYIPIGTDNNMITSNGLYSGIQPTVFMPGSNKFEIYFNGAQLTWTLKTYEQSTKVSLSAIASANSYQCEIKQILANSIQMSTGKPLGTHSDLISTIDNKKEILNNNLTAYPNPVSDRVTITWKLISGKELSITDLSGRQYYARNIRKLTENSIELDLSEFKTGFYLIRVKGDSSYNVLRIIKI